MNPDECLPAARGRVSAISGDSSVAFGTIVDITHWKTMSGFAVPKAAKSLMWKGRDDPPRGAKFPPLAGQGFLRSLRASATSSRGVPAFDRQIANH